MRFMTKLVLIINELSSLLIRNFSHSGGTIYKHNKNFYSIYLYHLLVPYPSLQRPAVCLSFLCWFQALSRVPWQLTHQTAILVCHLLLPADSPPGELQTLSDWTLVSHKLDVTEGAVDQIKILLLKSYIRLVNICIKLKK